MSDVNPRVERCEIVVGPSADALRRRVGPTGWCALECLVSQARRTDAGLVVETSVRNLANDLGIAKNTAHRALVSLSKSGLAAARQQRTEEGHFATGCYLLSVPEDAIATTPNAPADSSTSHTSPRRTKPATRAVHTQLSLLSAD